MIKRTHMVVGLSLLAVLGLGMLSGCAGKDKEAPSAAPQDQKQSNADGLGKETGGSRGTTSAAPFGAPGNGGKK